MWNDFTIFMICWAFIGAVSSIDTGFTVLCADELIHSEENPMARFILAIDSWKIPKFVSLKMFFTILVLGILAIMEMKKFKHYLTVAMSLALFQAWLLLYLVIN
jgi:hypothetical protein